MPVEEQKPMPAGLIKLVGRRYNTLVSLDAAPADKRTLEDELNVSRSTVDRAVRELEAKSLVNWSENGYQTTLYGRSMLAVYESILGHTEYVQQAKPLLAVLPPTADFDFSMLIDAVVSLSKESAPQAPTTHLTELCEQATELRAIYHSHFSSKLFDIISTKTRRDELQAELVFREPVFSHLKNEQPTKMRELEHSDQSSTYVVEDVPYGLFLLSTDSSQKACLVIYGHDQQLKGIIVNDNSHAVSWARQIFEEYRDEALFREKM